MKKIVFLLSFILIFSAQNPSLAQDENNQKKPSEEQISLPFTFPKDKTLIVKTKVSVKEGDFTVNFNSEYDIAYVKPEGENHLFKSEVKSVVVGDVTGLPNDLAAMIKELMSNTAGMKITYVGEKTGYPLTVKNDKDIKKFKSNLSKAMKKWVKDFSKQNKLSKAKRKQIEQVIDQSVNEAYPVENKIKIDGLVLSDFHDIFYGSNRNFYVNYQTEFQGQIFASDAGGFLNSSDTFEVTKINKENGYAEIYFWKEISAEQKKLLIETVKANLAGKYDQKTIDQVAAIWMLYEVKKEGQLFFDLNTGLIYSGVIQTTESYNGKTKIILNDFDIEEK